MKFLVTFTRLCEEECCVYIDAASEEEVYDKALDLLDDAPAELVWRRSDTEPHTEEVYEVEPAENLSKKE